MDQGDKRRKEARAGELKTEGAGGQRELQGAAPCREWQECNSDMSKGMESAVWKPGFAAWWVALVACRIHANLVIYIYLKE